MRGLLLWMVAMLMIGGSALARTIPEHVEAAEPVKLEHREIIIPCTPTPAPERPDFDLYNLTIIREENESNDRTGTDYRGAGEADPGTAGDDQPFTVVSGNVTGNAEGSEEGSEAELDSNADTDNSAILESEYTDNNGEPENNMGFNGNSEPELTYLGEWTITAYCAGSCCCGEYASGYTASGTLATEGRTVACNSLPMGTRIMIDGHEYTVEDTGWTPYGGAWIDIFFNSHEDALAWGVQTKEVYLVND